MKKIKIVAIATVVLGAALFTSCGNGMSTNVTLKTEIDSLSYAYGAGYYNFGLKGELEQQGLLGDTAQVKYTFQEQINQETDEAKKAELTKKMNQTVDSVLSANDRNKSAFFKGFQEGLSATDAKKAHIAGAKLAADMKQMMIPSIEQQLYAGQADKKINEQYLLAGILAMMKNEKLLIGDGSPEELEGYINSVFRRVQERTVAIVADQNIADGEKFLAENKAKEGVITLPSGIQYKVINTGTGDKPLATSKVKAHYHGTLLDGSVFDSSVDRNQPFEFVVNQMIPGWIEIVPMMPVGSKWQVYIPSHLAYGKNPTGPIKPGSTLIFDIDLLEILEK